MPVRKVMRVVTLLVATLALASCGGSSDVVVSDAWSFRPPPGQQVSAAYATVTNSGDSDIRIVGASAAVAEAAQLHETIVDEEGSAMMQERADGFVVPAGETFLFEPGGPHIMLLGVDPADYPDEIEISLELEGGAEVTFTAEVREVSGG